MKLGGILGFILIFFGITIAWGAWYTVGQGERGIKTRYGAIVEAPIEPGLHWKTPWVDSYDTISIASNKAVYENMEAYSRDQQPAHFKISVIYHIPPDKVGEVYWRYGGENGIVDRLLDRHVPQQSKNIFGQFNAISVIQERDRFNKEVGQAIMGSVKAEPVVVESVQVEDVQFSEDYIAAVKARMIAEVEVQKLHQLEEQQKVNAEITVINAKAGAEAVRAAANGAADARLAQATAEAKATELNGRALADALQLKGKALAENPRLVDMAVAEKWTGILPSQMIPGAALPILNLTPSQIEHGTAP